MQGVPKLEQVHEAGGPKVNKFKHFHMAGDPPQVNRFKQVHVVGESQVNNFEQTHVVGEEVGVPLVHVAGVESQVFMWWEGGPHMVSWEVVTG